MQYFEQLREITKLIPTNIVDFSIERTKSSAPTQASSNFITNKQQGDWAEDLIYRAINETSEHHVAVRYGKSDDLIAGDEGFDEFYREFQNELDTIGKRPDLLIFKKEDFVEAYGNDISKLEHTSIESYVKKAIAGLEIRSSAFLIDKYESEMSNMTQHHTQAALAIKQRIIEEFHDLLTDNRRSKYLEILNSINPQTIDSISFRRPSWRTTARLEELTSLFSELKEHIIIVQKRSYLSITPKVEDIKVVYRWAESFNVPHYYIQVFFDKSYGISFKNILQLVTNPDKEGVYYEISKDIKNQNKTTIKINTLNTHRVAYRIIEPEHHSVRRQMSRGRLLFYVGFKEGTAYLDIDSLKDLLEIEEF